MHGMVSFHENVNIANLLPFRNLKASHDHSSTSDGQAFDFTGDRAYLPQEVLWRQKELAPGHVEMFAEGPPQNI